jgi:hypothetical protein
MSWGRIRKLSEQRRGFDQARPPAKVESAEVFLDRYNIRQTKLTAGKIVSSA